MALSAFDDKSKIPEAAELEATLGRSWARWQELRAGLAAEFGPLEETWNFSGAKWGWALRLKRKKRTILYLTPRARSFLVGFALGEKAVEAAQKSGLPDEVLAVLDVAPRYPEGRGVRLEVRTKRDVEIVGRLAAIKMAN